VRRAGSISPKPARGAGFSNLNSEEVASRDEQRESAAEFASGDSIRRNSNALRIRDILCAVSNIIKQLPRKHCLAASNLACISVSFV
jgi:hypothetical protein